MRFCVIPQAVFISGRRSSVTFKQKPGHSLSGCQASHPFSPVRQYFSGIWYQIQYQFHQEALTGGRIHNFVRNKVEL